LKTLKLQTAINKKTIEVLVEMQEEINKVKEEITNVKEEITRIDKQNKLFSAILGE